MYQLSNEGLLYESGKRNGSGAAFNSTFLNGTASLIAKKTFKRRYINVRKI